MRASPLPILLVFCHRSPQESPRFDRLVKVDLERGGVADMYCFPPSQLLVTEPTFVPKVGKGDPSQGGVEDDGYVIIVVSRVPTDGDLKMGAVAVLGSSMLVFDARDLAGGPVSQVALPDNIPFGLHSEWIPFDALVAD